MTDEPDDTGTDRPPHGFESVKLPGFDVSQIGEQIGALVPQRQALDQIRRTSAFASVHDQLESLAKAFTRELPVSKAILAETQRRNAFVDALPKWDPPPQVERPYLAGNVLADVRRVEREREQAQVAREERTIRLLEENLQRQDAQLDISRQLVEASTPRRHTGRLLGVMTVAAVSANFAGTWAGKMFWVAGAAVVYLIIEVVDRKARRPAPR